MFDDVNSFPTLLFIKECAQRLIACCSSEYEALDQAWQLLEKVTGKTKVQLVVARTMSLTPVQKNKLDEMIDQRIKLRKPLQYIIGSVLFAGLEIQVRAPILIPRPETEEWVLWLIKTMHDAGMSLKPLKILDLCTGTGCIALALAKALPLASVWGIDINPSAIALAQENKCVLGIDNVAFIGSDLYNVVPEGLQFDLIVSNPPYIMEHESVSLQPEVREWEDRKALVIDDDQLLYKRIIEGSKTRINLQRESIGEGVSNLVLEVGSQGEKVMKMLIESGFEGVCLYKDMSGCQRWIGARFDNTCRF